VVSSGSNTRSVSAAVSDESVAGDSGVFEASKMQHSQLEAAQIQIRLRYAQYHEGHLKLVLDVEFVRETFPDLSVRLAPVDLCQNPYLHLATTRDRQQIILSPKSYNICWKLLLFL